MNLTSQGTVLQVGELNELNATNAAPFREHVRGALAPEHTHIQLDFQRLAFLDSSGLGALISLHKAVVSRGGMVRLLNPTPQVQQLLEMTRMVKLFEVIRT